MTYDLLIGNRSYSSWSLRGWLPFAVWDIPVRVQTTILYREAFARDLAAFDPGLRTVPVVRTPDGALLTDSIAIAWDLAEAFPDRALLPAIATDRAMAQSLVAEMHSGFSALRRACPMNLRTAWDGFVPAPEVLADLARIEALWHAALDRSSGPFLFGSYTLADAFYAPVAMRIAGYGLSVADRSKAYVAAHLGHAPLRHWRAWRGRGPRAADLRDGPAAPPLPDPATLTIRPQRTGVYDSVTPRA